MTTRSLSRRKLLLAAGGALTAGAALDSFSAQGTSGLPSAADLPFSPSAGDIVAGVIERIEAPETLYVRATQDLATVNLSPGATVWHDQPARIEAFVPGEEVVAEGHWLDGALAATSLINIYRLAEGPILEKAGDRLTTADATIRLTEHTRFQEGELLRPLSDTDLSVGDYIAVLGRVDPATGDLVALRINRRE